MLNTGSRITSRICGSYPKTIKEALELVAKIASSIKDFKFTFEDFAKPFIYSYKDLTHRSSVNEVAAFKSDLVFVSPKYCAFGFEV